MILRKGHIVISMHPSFSDTLFYNYDRMEKELISTVKSEFIDSL